MALFVAAIAVFCCISASKAKPAVLKPEPIAMPGFPVKRAVVDGWVNAHDKRLINAHAWALWQGINTKAKGSPLDRVLPVWETWYADQEVIAGSNCKSPISAAAGQWNTLRASGLPVHPFAALRQFTNLSQPPPSDERPVGFTRFNCNYTDFLVNSHFTGSDGSDSLWKIWNQQTKKGLPDSDRAIPPFPREAIGLKVVFEVAKQPDPKTHIGITVLPYWAGPTNSSTPARPVQSTWNQCVIVNTGDTLPAQLPVCMNGAKASGVVDVNKFYNFPMTDVEAKTFCSGPQCSIKAGDYAILVGMHLTTKENSNWTWQTFWWNYDQTHTEPSSGEAPPPGIPAPYNHYAMCTAYSMTIAPPNDAKGTNTVCYNPYLETLDINGVHSNCMTCHGVASFGMNPKASSPTNPDVYPKFVSGTTSYISPLNAVDDPVYFDCQTTTDFSWFTADTLVHNAPNGLSPCKATSNPAANPR